MAFRPYLTFAGNCREAFTLYQKVLGDLFDNEKDPIKLIKWKEIYDTLETTIDQAEDVANDLESIALKHA